MVSNMPRNETTERLQTSYNELAPNKDRQENMIKIIADLRKHNAEEKEIQLAIIGGMYDGLAYGNW